MDFKPSEKEKENIIVRTPPRSLSIAYFTALNTSLNLTARPPQPVHIFTALVEPDGTTSPSSTAPRHRFFHSALFVPHCLHDRFSSFSPPSSFRPSCRVQHFVVFFFSSCLYPADVEGRFEKLLTPRENSLSFQTCRIGRVCVLYSIYFLSGQIFTCAWHPPPPAATPRDPSLVRGDPRAVPSRLPARVRGTVDEMSFNNGYPPTPNDVTREI